MEKDTLHKEHRKRVRERYLKEGLDSFQPHQVLEMILFYAIARKDTNELAHNLLDKFGTLKNVFNAQPKELMEVTGVGENTAILLNMFSQVRRKCDIESVKEIKHIKTSMEAGRFCINLFYGRFYESFFLVCLNSKNKILNTEKLSEGTLKEVAIYPRNIVRTALQNNAAKVILAHNHPGGAAYPSDDDMASTRDIGNALKMVDIELFDHIVVAENNYMSFKEFNIL